ncbi:3-beta-hydroxysteroid dehydrogenase [Luminiphilus syltensis NOR5-1B]|uniref:3-beta-hydroxysteroid dehydrogenase n=1 Tax=Luminiphilus syltensis NOR5-1B TaxID=565045 RepID=B8KVV2_9GAMM|nr:glucose 1-dehydrogenase [Luminiphilus syltensis]EED34673.1 3-beta-hydroxysteroid dehydrogenase [Luminiphilus syltensis NOR5-1B]
MSDKRLAGKTAIVTGGASGLGLGIAQRYIEHGANVIITDINVNAGEQAAAKIGARFLEQDVTDESSWEALFTTLTNEQVHASVLVNNAGFADAGLGVLFEDIDVAEAKKIFTVNVDGTILGCKHAIRHMKQNGGSIINMSSIAAMVPVPFIAAYGASKAAVRHLTQSVALYCAQQGYRIRCNSIHPGQIRTAMHNRLVEATAKHNNITATQAEAGFLDMIPMGEFGQVEDIANAALYFANDESKHVTGDRILVDGGMMLTS